MGVGLVDINGKTKPTGQLLLEISDAFNKLPPGTKLSSDALDVFKRIGIETIPFLQQLRSHTEYFKANGLPAASQAEIDQSAAYERQIVAIDTRWEALKRSFKEEIVAKVTFVGTVGGAVVSLIDAVTHASALLGHLKKRK